MSANQKHRRVGPLRPGNTRLELAILNRAVPWEIGDNEEGSGSRSTTTTLLQCFKQTETKTVMTSANDDGRHLSVGAGRCPLCGSLLIEGRCNKCKFCGVCGSPWEGDCCPNCFPVAAPAYAPSDSNSVVEEAALDKRETEKLLGPMTPARFNALRSRPSEARKRAEIHEMVEKAVSAWALPPATKDRISDDITLRVTREIRHGDELEIKPLIASFLYEEAARLGLGIAEVNRALAVMGLNTPIRQDSHWLILLVSGTEFKIFVGDIERGGKSSEMKKDSQWSSWLEIRGYPPDSMIVRARVPLYLSDAGTTKIRVEGAIILEYMRKRHATLVDPSTLTIKVDPAESFYAWRSMKKVRLDDGGSGVPSQYAELDRTARAKRFMLGKGMFPKSTELAEVAGCIREINALFLRKFKEKMNDEGRAWKTVAIEALCEVDEEVFQGIPRVKRGSVMMALSNMNLGKRDLEHTGIRGVLVTLGV